jgi:hypothetical protein
MAKEFSLEEALGTGTQKTTEFSLDEALGRQPKDQSFLRQVADVPLSVGRGAVTGVRMIADAFGAGSGASEALKGAEGYLAGLMSAQSKNDEKEVARILKDAEDKGMLDQVKAGFKAFSVAPIDLLSQGFGTAAPAVLGILGGKVLGAGALGMKAAGVGIGAGMGAGSIKGGIYEETKAALREAGIDEAKAEQAAIQAQEYGGKNLDQILLGAGLGGVGGRFGVESAARRIMTKAAGQETAKGAAREVAEGAARTAVTEAVPELLQGSQEQVAKNIALQREGFDVPTMRGVAGSGTLEALAGAGLGAVTGGTEAGLRRQARGEADRILAEEEKTRAEAPVVVEPAAVEPSPTQAIEDQAAELERQQQRQQAAMDRARAGGIGGGSEVNQTMLEQARIRKEQQERAAAAEEKAAEVERQKALRAERVRIGSTQYSGDPMMNEVLRSRAIADFDAANTPKPEAPKPAPEYQPTKTIEETTPIEQPEGVNVLRGLDYRDADFRTAMAERRAAEEAAAATQTKQAEAQKVEQAAKTDASRADVDLRVAQVENYLMSPAKKTQQETADYMAGVIPEMQKDFLALLDEDMSQPLTPEQTEALKAQIRQRIKPDFIPEENVQRTPFKRFLAAKGMNKKDVQDIFGENAYRANQQLPGAIKADGPRLDMLAEAAVEAGFLQNEDTEALVDMIKAEFGGDEQVSVDMSGDRAAAEYEAQRESELESRAAVIGLKTKGMTPDQIAARLDRIERKREEKRKQYSRSVDGFADLPTEEQDRIIDMMIDQFGEPQVFDVERAEIEGRVREEEELLQTQSEQQLRDKQAEIDRLAKENERLSKEAERKAKADEEAGDFTLTGSDRVADKAAARGQMDLTEDEKPTREEVLSGVKALAEKLLSKGTVKYEDTELGGEVYQVITRTFEGKLFGSELRTVREALGNATEVTLVNEEDQVMTLSLTGRNVGEGANVRVMDSKYVPEDQVEDKTEDSRTSEEIKDAIIALNKRMSSTLTSKGNTPAKGSKGYEAYQALKKERDRLVKKFDEAEARENADSDSQKDMRSAEGGRGYDINAEDQRIEKELTGKSMIQAADWAVANAPNAFAKVIAEKVRNRLREFQRKGMTLEFNIVGGSTRPMVLSGARGITKPEWGKDDKGSKFTVTLNGAAVIDNQAGYPPGVQYNTILHELLHVATRSQFVFMPNTDPLKKQMAELFDLVVTRFNADAKAGTLPPVMVKYYKRMNNVLEDADELLTWGLTDKDVQAYFDDIKVGEKSVFTRLVELIRTALGLGKPYESALERLVRTSESMLDVDVDSIDAMLGQRDKQIGVKKKPAGPMKQESLFQKEGEAQEGDVRYQREGQPDPTRQNIFGEPVLGTWSITVDPKMELQDGLIYKMLDKNIDVKRIVEAVKSTGKEIASRWNPYLQEELYHGRTANASQEFQDNEWLPLLQDMDKKGVTVGELEKYLLNRHAEEYNKLVAKRNPTRPEMQDGGSSVTTEAAREYLAGLDKDTKVKYEELAKRIDGITKGTRQLLVDTGYEKAETIEGWEKAFPNYVPLMREEANFDYNFGSFGTGRGFDVRRDFSRSAMGSKRNVVDIIGNVISARNNAIALTEKNRVAQAVYGLAVDAPNPDFWMAINPDAEKIPEDAIDELRAMGLDEEAVKHLMKEPKQRMLDPKRDEIVSRVNTKLRENDYVLATRINGERRYVFFNPKDPRANRAATALKNLGAQDLGVALGLIAKVTRWMASVNTQYNPIFGPYNFLRDVQSAALQLSTTELAGQQKEIAANVVPSLRVIYSSLRKRRKGEKVEGELADLWKEFQKEGGQTGFRDNFSRTQDRTEALINEMERITEGKVKANARAVFDWLSDYNDSLENAVRLSAYKVAKEKFAAEGFSDSEVKQKAASLAKNLTVNFNRKGDVATQMGALYAFFNASMQGTARMIETLKGPTGKKIIAGGLLLGGMQAALLAAAGFDDEEPPEFIRSKNIVIPTGDGDYIAFPMPLGFHVIPGVSRILTEWTLSGFKDTARRVTDLTGLFLDAFNPIGNAGWSVQTITPTILDPLVALGENKDWTGKPISKEDLFSLRPTPGYTRAREGANVLSTSLAEFLNYASGGTKHQPGVLSPTPEQIEYLVGQAFGGVGREAMKLATTAEKTVTGEELPPYKIPLYGRFVGETKSSAAESNRFYKNMERLNRLDLEIKGRREDREPVGDFIRENPEARLLPMANKTYKDVQELRKRRKALLERDAPRESIQAVEKQITRKMQLLNDRVKAFEER